MVLAQIQVKRGTAATWTSDNPTLAAGEIGWESDTNQIKVGDGSTAWTSLAYFGGGSGDVATDAIWDAKGDLAAGTGANTASKLSVGADGRVLMAASGEATGLEWRATTGSGDVARATSPTLVTPVLGTPTSGNLTNCSSTSLKLKDSVADHNVSLVIGDDQNADRTLTFVMNDANRQVSLGGNLTVAANTSITSAAATVLDDTSVADMVTTLGGASSTGSGGLARATSPTFVTPALGTVASGNVAACTGMPYTLSVGATSYNPNDGVTNYFGNRYNSPTSTADVTRVYVPRAGTIKRADILGFAGTAGSNEAWEFYIRLNNTTDTLIQSVASSSATRVWSNSSLSITVAAGDYFEIKMVNPTWVATNPAAISFGGNIYIET